MSPDGAMKPTARGNVVKLHCEVPEELALLRRLLRLFGVHGPLLLSAAFAVTSGLCTPEQAYQRWLQIKAKAARGRRKSGPLAG
jgi:hypothetical protein